MLSQIYVSALPYLHTNSRSRLGWRPKRGRKWLLVNWKDSILKASLVEWSIIIGQERKIPLLHSSFARLPNIRAYYLLYWRLECRTGRKSEHQVGLRKFHHGLQRGWSILRRHFRMAAIELLWKFHHRLMIRKGSLPHHHWVLVRELVFEDRHPFHLCSVTSSHSNSC